MASRANLIIIPTLSLSSTTISQFLSFTLKTSTWDATLCPKEEGPCQEPSLEYRDFFLKINVHYHVLNIAIKVLSGDLNYIYKKIMIKLEISLHALPMNQFTYRIALNVSNRKLFPSTTIFLILQWSPSGVSVNLGLRKVKTSTPARHFLNQNPLLLDDICPWNVTILFQILSPHTVSY